MTNDAKCYMNIGKRGQNGEMSKQTMKKTEIELDPKN